MIIGTLTLDFDGQVEAVNMKTRDVIMLDLFEGKRTLFGGETAPSVKGIGYSKYGEKLLEMSGSWWDKIVLKYKDEAEEVVWKQPEAVLHSHLQYNFLLCTILLNYKNDQMRDIVAPTDSRWRKD